MPADADEQHSIGRRTPAKGVLPTFDGPTILWCTICAESRGDWCAAPRVMVLLQDIWQYAATAWLVGDYLLMPDHVHFFCTPGPGRFFEVEQWAGFWKDQFSKRVGNPVCRWQSGLFHHRLRNEREFADKGVYMRNNPVRRNLVRHPDEWPWQGRVHQIRW